MKIKINNHYFSCQLDVLFFSELQSHVAVSNCLFLCSQVLDHLFKHVFTVVCQTVLQFCSFDHFEIEKIIAVGLLLMDFADYGANLLQ